MTRDEVSAFVFGLGVYVALCLGMAALVRYRRNRGWQR